LATNAESVRTWRNGRAAAGALGLLFSAVYLLEGRDLRMGTMDAPGPGVFPLIVGILFALVSIGVIAEALLTREPGTAAFPKGPDRKRLIVVFAAFVAYILLLQVLGFLVATVLFVAFYCRIAGEVPWKWSLVSGAGVAAAVWLVFAFLLEVRLPEAIWS
jgi:putative tricarboxylic transport membrane protein